MALQPPSNLEALIEVAEKEQARFDKRRHPLSIVGVTALLFGLATSLAYTLGAFWFSLPKP